MRELKEYFTARYVRAKVVDQHFYLSGELGPPENYTDLIETLKVAAPEDVIYLHLNGPGGDLSTAIQIIHATNQSDGVVVGCAEGNVYSAYSAIFFSCHTFQIGDLASFMLHDAHHIIGGKVSETVVQADHSSELVRKVAKQAYGKFLTKKEMKKLLKGKDMYMFADEVVERITKAAKKEEKRIES